MHAALFKILNPTTSQQMTTTKLLERKRSRVILIQYDDDDDDGDGDVVCADGGDEVGVWLYDDLLQLICM